MFEPGIRKPLFNGEIRRRGIYLLPNLFTTAALFSGFYAIAVDEQPAAGKLALE